MHPSHRQPGGRGSAGPASARPASSGTPAGRAYPPVRGPARRRRPVPAARPAAGRFIESGPRIGHRGEPRWHRSDSEIERFHRVQLIPGHRRRHGRLRSRPHRVDGGHGAIAGRLVEVDEHALAALFLPPVHRDQPGQPPVELAAECDHRPSHLRECPLRRDRHGHVHAPAAGSLREAGAADRCQYLPRGLRRGHRVSEGGARLRVEVDPQLVRVVDVRSPDRPRVELHRAQIRRPREHGRLGRADFLGGPAAGELNLDLLHPVRRPGRHPLLEERLALDPVREPAQRGRPVPQRGADPVADRDVVADQFFLGHPGRREHDLRRAADPQ